MSTFGGKIQEIPGVSVDRFDENNFESEVYFLSHCHTDHMVGLSRYVFQEILVQYHKFIYTSDISCEILKQMYPCITKNVKVLDMYKPTIIRLKHRSICVTPLPAGHCPGSVMFLFETDAYILYTGDYRINKSDIKKIKAFYDSFNEVKVIEKIYLDTTFFLTSYLKFPKREDSLKELCKLIQEWTDKGKNYLVNLNTSAKYGYEYVYNEVYQRTGMPVHVNRTAYKLYSMIPEMDNSITLHGDITQIHSNCGLAFRTICVPWSSDIRTIKVSAFRWTQNKLEDGLSSSESNMHYVCYSTHASYEEGIELIKFLKPKSIEACVTHSDAFINLEMMNLIKDVLKEFNLEESSGDKPKLFETKHTEKVCDSLESNCSSFKDEFGVLNSPRSENIRRELIKECTVEADFAEKVSVNLKNYEGLLSNGRATSEACEVEKDDRKILQTASDKVKRNLSNDCVVSTSAKWESVKKPLSDSAREEFQTTNICDPENIVTEEKRENIESDLCKDVFWFFESPPQECIESSVLKENAQDVEDLKESEAKESMITNPKDGADNLERESSSYEFDWILDSPPKGVEKEKETSDVSISSTENLKEYEIEEGIPKKPKLCEAQKNFVESLEDELSELNYIQWILDSPQIGVKSTENVAISRGFETKSGDKLCEMKQGCVINARDGLEGTSTSFNDTFCISDSPPCKFGNKECYIEVSQLADRTEDVILNIINSPPNGKVKPREFPSPPPVSPIFLELEKRSKKKHGVVFL